MRAHGGSLLAALIALAACGGDAPGGEAAARESGDGPSLAGRVAPTLAPAFDPATLSVGDTLLGLTVQATSLERVFEDSVWVGDVELAGDLVVQGVYQLHPDWPAVTLPCFHVNDPGSIARIPRFPPDDRTTQTAKTWFCFDPSDVAVQVLGPPDPPREMVVAVDRYHVRRHFTDAFDTAELSELIEAGAPAGRTLLDP